MIPVRFDSPSDSLHVLLGSLFNPCHIRFYFKFSGLNSGFNFEFTPFRSISDLILLQILLEILSVKFQKSVRSISNHLWIPYRFHFKFPSDLFWSHFCSTSNSLQSPSKILFGSTANSFRNLF